MSFDTLRVKVGRRPVTIVELDVDFCGNAYGDAPCEAVLGLTGTQKCFNTFHTCQDRANFTKTKKTYRFCDESSFLPVGMDAIPCITGTDIAPTQLDPKGLSVSAAVTITFKDFPHHDRGTDPYYSGRDYDAMAQGTFWGKFRSRNPFLVNRPIRVLTGYIEANGTVSTRSRTYFIKNMEGPDANGVVKIMGTDILRFSEKDGAQVPVASTSVLDGSVDDNDTSLTLTSIEEFPNAGRVRIGDELIDYTGKGSDSLEGCQRGVVGTTAASHDTDSKVQLCTVFANATVDEVLSELLTTYAGVESSYIPSAEWASENADWLGSFLCNVTLSDPADVKDVLKEVLLASGSVLWWDEVEAKLKWKVIAPLQPSGEVRLINETDHILEGSFRVRDLEKERISRVFMYLNQISAVGDMDRKAFRTVSAIVDNDMESENAYDATKLLEIVNRWIPNSIPLADEIGNRFLVRYATTPREIEFKLDAKDFTLKTGDIVDVAHRLIQLPDGSAGSVRFLVTECKEQPIGSQASYTCIQIYPVGGGQSWLFAPDDCPDWDAATSEQRALYMFFSDDAGAMPDLVDAPRLG